MKRMLAGLMVMTIVALYGLAGCTAAKKPEKKPASPRTTQTPSPAPKSTAPGATSDRAIADRVAREAVKVKGVKEASVVISGKTAYIGLNLSPDVKEDETTAVKRNVASRIKSAEPSLKKVNVTSDPDLVARLKRIANDVKNGKPVSSFSTELAEIERRITPKMK